MNRVLLSNLTTGLLVACAVTVTAAVVRRDVLLARASAAQPDLTPRRVSNWPELVSAGERVGPNDARVTIVEFSDFQCPFCARTQPAIEAVLHRHPDVALLYRHFPLDAIHLYARPAAIAAECAAAQGRFEPYANLLFAQQDSLGTKAWSRFASEAAVADLDRFDRCVIAAQPAGRVDLDARVGKAMDVQVTPTLVIDGVMHPGAVTEAQLDSLVRRAGAR